ncbi:tRNA (guanine-9-) methyltransferase [Anaeramoeba ignava]|uniref:tRNA (guanine(9)-N(1))-methyltransferase n=1 Tax=Anaeramoeba ignava TaxID=1746090 RepID=A0A9Q0R982_ANAIG|nr:tRNA (guanine-9-) methyltransferase [Anaeramoeba ignava]
MQNNNKNNNNFSLPNWLSSNDSKSLSKHAIKKLEKIQFQKQKQKEKKKRKKNQSKKIQNENQQKEQQNTTTPTKKDKQDHEEKGSQIEDEKLPRKISRKNRKKIPLSNFRIVIDCSFDELMSVFEIKKLTNQINMCYGANNKAEKPIKLYLAGLIGRTKAKLESTNGFLNWRIFYDEKKYQEIFKKDEIIYLTSESEEVLDEIYEDKVYIIGGLVDHNRLKGLTYEEAKKIGIKTAKLPIDQYLSMRSRKVLTVDQVFSIILNYINCKDWSQALIKAIPLRKGAKVKKDQNLKENQNLKQNQNENLNENENENENENQNQNQNQNKNQNQNQN